MILYTIHHRKAIIFTLFDNNLLLIAEKSRKCKNINKKLFHLFGINGIILATPYFVSLGGFTAARHARLQIDSFATDQNEAYTSLYADKFISYSLLKGFYNGTLQQNFRHIQ